jgi:hypothetical protein
MTLDTVLYHRPTGVLFLLSGYLLREGAGFYCGYSLGVWVTYPASECEAVG